MANEVLQTLNLRTQRMKTPNSPLHFTIAITLMTASAAFGQRPAPQRAERPRIRVQAVATRPGPAQFGDPLPGLAAADLLAFGAGKEEFENVETPDGGLGPIFNNVSCVACHSSRATGGASAITVTRFGRTVNGIFDGYGNAGGSLLQDHAIDPAVAEVVPEDATIIAQRQSTPLFGLGLIEAIPDASILALANRPVRDGIKGRAAMVVDVATSQLRVGRFGWKNQVATLLTFAGDAYVNEMGITSRLFPTENAPNGDLARLAAFDLYADPEDTIDPAVNKSDIDAAADFMRLLAPPPTVPLTQAARSGQQLFQQINCTACHQPVLTTGASPIAAISNKNVPLYSDLLLHEMGALGDGIEHGVAKGNEFRTAPLWGLRASGPYLHDGRAMTVDEAIRAHDGEAANPRDRYLRLTPTQRQQLIAFLNSI